MELERVQKLIVDKLTAARDGEKRDVLIRMARLAGGYAAGGCGTVADWRNLLTETVKALKWSNLKKCEGHIDAGLSYGQAKPIYPTTTATDKGKKATRGLRVIGATPLPATVVTVQNREGTQYGNVES